LAYILNLNDIIGADDVLDAQSLPKVKMPNRDGFILFPRFSTGRGRDASYLAPLAQMRTCSFPAYGSEATKAMMQDAS
jgi:hypothetical protein